MGPIGTVASQRIGATPWRRVRYLRIARDDGANDYINVNALEAWWGTRRQRAITGVTSPSMPPYALRWCVCFLETKGEGRTFIPVWVGGMREQETTTAAARLDESR